MSFILQQHYQLTLTAVCGSVWPRLRDYWRAILLCIGLLPAVYAQQSWQINLKDADVLTFIQQVAEMTGKSFIIDPKVRGKVNVISPVSLDQQAVYQLFLATLAVHGYTAVENQGVIQIIPSNNVKSSGGAVDNEQRVIGQEFVTRVIPITNGSAQELVPILRPLASRYAHLAGVQSANAIIIADHDVNIRRISRIIDSLNNNEAESIDIIELEHAWVGSIIGLLEKLVPEEVTLTGGEQGGAVRRTHSAIRLVADERGNRLILRGDPGAIKRIKQLVTTLDVPTDETSSSTVIFLNNADAKKLSELLKGFAGVVQQTQDAGSGQGAPPAEPVAILADEDLNALVIRAEPAVLAELQAIVTELDIRRTQVLIEAAIFEINLDDKNSLGVQVALNPETIEQGYPLAASNISGEGSSLASVAQGILTQNLSALPNSAVLGVVGGSSPIKWGALLQAIQTQSNGNILSTTSI